MKLWRANRLIAAAAHLALLLAVCAPVVSRLMLPNGMVMNDHAMMAMTISDAIAMSHCPAKDMASVEKHPAGQSPVDACEYCSLFAHLPYVVAFAATLAILPALPAPAFPATRAQLGEETSHLAFRPRGPPTALVPA